jgi:hypothetical protein
VGLGLTNILTFSYITLYITIVIFKHIQHLVDFRKRKALFEEGRQPLDIRANPVYFSALPRDGRTVVYVSAGHCPL